MKILLCHNYYQQPGGEDRVFAAEGSLLESHGHDVLRYTRHNDGIETMGRADLLRRTLWNAEVYEDLRHLIRRHRPQVMHCHNTFPLLSPSTYQAARDEGVPVVQTLHNYRLLCLNAMLYRDGQPCEDCLGRTVAWPGVRHACYRDSRAASAATAAMLLWHRARRTWLKAVDHYVALCQFSRQKFLEAGFPAEKISVKPNFAHPDRGAGRGGDYALFVGRLTPEKGLHTLLSAWSRLHAQIPLRILGDGPWAPRVAEAAAADPRISWLGHRPPDDVHAAMRGAACLVMPSQWYETFGLTIIESFAAGTPVIASRLGAMCELVDDHRTGLHFTPGDAADLAAKVEMLWDDRARLATMRCAARQEYERRYTAEVNYRLLLEVYRRAGAAIDANLGSRDPAPACNPGVPARV